jgi:putative restriction endonuclease
MKRPSGGRGEYEIAEPQGSIVPNDLVDKDLSLDCTPYAVRETGVVVRFQGGKLRLRKNPPRRAPQLHFHTLVQALLLLPKPIRDETGLIGGRPVLMENRYILRQAMFRDVSIAGGTATVRIGNVVFDNGSGALEEQDFTERLSRVKRIHDVAGEYLEPISSLLLQHRDMVQSPELLKSSAETLIHKLMQSLATDAPDYGLDYVSGTDVLEALEQILKLQDIPKPPSIADIPPEDIQIRRREAGRWRRWAASRGSASAKFSRSVRDAYHSTCLVCGLKLPKNKYCEVPGVDAAHILPWAGYDLDIVANGICLCKLHHWAFDQQLITLAVDGGTYVVAVSDKGEYALAHDPDSLAALRSVEGPVSADRLPTKTEHRPGVQFLRLLYEEVPADTSAPDS